MTVHRIVITPTPDKEGRLKRSSKGPLFDASYEGQIIVLGSTEPCFDAARVPKARGLTGRLEMWDTVLPYCRLHTDIDKAAGLTIEEGDRLPTLRKYREFSGRPMLDGNFASGGTRIPQTAETRPSESPAGVTGNVAGDAT